MEVGDFNTASVSYVFHSLCMSSTDFSDSDTY